MTPPDDRQVAKAIIGLSYEQCVAHETDGCEPCLEDAIVHTLATVRQAERADWHAALKKYGLVVTHKAPDVVAQILHSLIRSKPSPMLNWRWSYRRCTTTGHAYRNCKKEDAMTPDLPSEIMNQPRPAPDLASRLRAVLEKYQVLPTIGTDKKALLADLLAEVPQPNRKDLEQILQEVPPCSRKTYLECLETKRIDRIMAWATTPPPKVCPTCGQPSS